MPRAAVLVPAAERDRCVANGVLGSACVGELGRIVEHEHGITARLEPGTCGFKVAGENGALVDVFVVKEPVRGFGRRPVLAGQRQGLANVLGHA